MRYFGLANIILITSLALLSCHRQIHAQAPIIVDELGYRPGDQKLAFTKEAHADPFVIVDTKTNKEVFRGQPRQIGINDPNTGESVFGLDFSGLSEPGTYRIVFMDTADHSDPFSINDDVYTSVALASLRSFYFQRCGTEVGEGTPWSHKACHTRPALFFDDPSKSKDVSGGWHDAGDYNKFVPTTAVSAAFLLYIYSLQPQKFDDGQLRIPESHNGIPDILDEARWGLAWLLKMQRSDGGVYHKVSIKEWTGEHLPDEETDTQYIFDVSSTATGDFAAVTALGARIFARWDKAFADELLRSSENAWSFLDRHQTIVPPGGFKNPDGVQGGEYGDGQDEDERMWAAVELFRTTGNTKYNEYFLAHYKDLGGVNYTVSWQNVQNFAYFSYLNVPIDARNYDARSFIIATMTTYCDALWKQIRGNGYRYVLTPEQEYWGSNSVALGHAFDLINAFEFTKFRGYLEGAVDQLHYMLGRNAFGTVFVTGDAPHFVHHPYHQWSMLEYGRDPIPGLLVGGCNKFSRLGGRELSQYPGLCYEDNPKNYYVNEPAINYTAAFAYVASYCASMGGQNMAEQK